MYCIPTARSNSSKEDSPIPTSMDKNEQQEPFVVLVQIIGNEFGIFWNQCSSSPSVDIMTPVAKDHLVGSATLLILRVFSEKFGKKIEKKEKKKKRPKPSIRPPL